MHPTGMTPQRCMSALRALRTDLERAGAGSALAADAAAEDLFASDDIRSLRSALRLDVDLRRDGEEGQRMTGVERTIYLPLIIGVLALLERAEPPLPEDARALLANARELVDRALLKVGAAEAASRRSTLP